jgi:YVTN family beta-propeller protein
MARLLVVDSSRPSPLANARAADCAHASRGASSRRTRLAQVLLAFSILILGWPQNAIARTTRAYVTVAFSPNATYGCSNFPLLRCIFVLDVSPGVTPDDTGTNTIVAKVGVPGECPGPVAVNALGASGYFTDACQFPAPAVNVLDTTSNPPQIIKTLSLVPGSEPQEVTINPTMPRAYVTNRCDTYFCPGTGSVSVIDTSTNSLMPSINVGFQPIGLAVNRAGTRLYVANFCGDNSCPPYFPGGTGGTPGTISVIDTSTNTVRQTIPMSSNPNHVAVGLDGSRLYVTNLDNTVVVIDATEVVPPHVIATVPVGSNPQGLAVNTTGRRVYVANFGADPASVSVIDTSTNQVSATLVFIDAGLGVARYATGVAVDPGGRRVYVMAESAVVTDVGRVGIIDDTTTPPTLLFFPNRILVGEFPVAGSQSIAPSCVNATGETCDDGTPGAACVDLGRCSAGLCNPGTLNSRCDPTKSVAGRMPISGPLTLMSPDVPPTATVTIPAGALPPGVPVVVESLTGGNFSIGSQRTPVTVVDVRSVVQPTSPVKLKLAWKEVGGTNSGPPTNPQVATGGLTPIPRERELQIFHNGAPIVSNPATCTTANNAAQPAGYPYCGWCYYDPNKPLTYDVTYVNGQPYPYTDNAKCSTACSGLECCCDPFGNFWEFQTNTFSEFAVATRACGTADRVRLAMANLGVPTQGKLGLSGQFTPANPAAFDPVASGVEVILGEGTQAPDLDVSVPGGAFNATLQTGWLVSRRGDHWTYFDRTPAPPGGIYKVDLRKLPSGLVRFAAWGRGGSYTATTGVNVGLQLLNTSECLTNSFPGPVPAPICRMRGTALRCR